MRPTWGRARARTGADSGGPLNLIHTTKSPNPSPARVSSRFSLVSREPEGVPLGDVLEMLEGRLDPLSSLVARRFNVDAKT